MAWMHKRSAAFLKCSENTGYKHFWKWRLMEAGGLKAESSHCNEILKATGNLSPHSFAAEQTPYGRAVVGKRRNRNSIFQFSLNIVAIRQLASHHSSYWCCECSHKNGLCGKWILEGAPRVVGSHNWVPNHAMEKLVNVNNKMNKLTFMSYSPYTHISCVHKYSEFSAKYLRMAQI